MGIKLALFVTDIYKLDNKGKAGCSLKAVGTLPSNGVQWSHFLVFMFFVTPSYTARELSSQLSLRAKFWAAES